MIVYSRPPQPPTSTAAGAARRLCGCAVAALAPREEEGEHLRPVVGPRLVERRRAARVARLDCRAALQQPQRDVLHAVRRSEVQQSGALPARV
eukprot:CAMPEP_0185418414 /NCGR_PEP_ID=MMETSP1365-20130426/8758_1 /TAXON_ID=38817 /ORGANISM="Gephyrocapsa oceanica, Strain RCC1303" /LENGTH=92 /DNA_ID=CAMNT_0028021873 /DNA_START=180 /DNA_END=455 /DNA_ORIENTATION=+